MPSDHALWHSPLFCHPQVLQRLRQNVVCGPAEVGDVMQPTGIPPHIQVLVEHEKTQNMLQNLPNQLMDGMQNLLEQRDFAAGNMTPGMIQQLFTQSINNAFRQLGLGQYNQQLGQPQRQQEEPEVEELQQQEQSRWLQWHQWGGQFHPIPENFKIPSLTVQTMWRLWMCGNEDQNMPPLRMIAPKDLNDKERKKLSRLKVTMRLLEQKVRSLDCWVDPSRTQVTMEQATTMFEAARCVLPDPPVSRQCYQRRVGQVTWRTMTNLIRQKRRADELEPRSQESRPPQPPSQRQRID